MLNDAPASSESQPVTPRYKILYVQPGTQSFAGIERVVDTICSQLAVEFADEFQIDVLYTSVHKNFPAEPRRYKAIHRVATTRRMLLHVIRSTIQGGEYDLVVVPQIEPMVICWVACLGLGQRFAMHLHGNPRRERSHAKAKILFWLMKTLVIRRLSAVFGTSPRQLDAFAAMFPSDVPRVWLPNPVRRFAAAARTAVENRAVTFVNVGRFCHQKGQDLLIDAFHELHRERSDIRLKLVGHGADEASLRGQIERLGLSHAVDIEFHPDNPESVLADSDVYVSTSRWEGWSLAICEALRFGLPVVATDCEFGPSDILDDTRLGRLVSPASPDQLVAAMRYYRDHLPLERSHAECRRNAIDRFSPEQVVHTHVRALRLACQA